MNTQGPAPQDDAELEVAEALADKAMLPWNDKLLAADRARMRDALIEALATHPNAQRLVAQLARPPVVEESGEVGDDDDGGYDVRPPSGKRGAGVKE